jgi:arylsulfatase A-like enzyme
VNLGLLVGVLLAGGCGKSSANQAAPASNSGAKPAPLVSATASAAPAPRQPLNVLLLTVEAMRADMPWAGYARPIAPNLTKLAQESVIYDNYRSVSSFTAQSVPVILSGRYTSTLYRTGYFFAGYSLANHFFPEVLAEKGIRTIALHAHLYFSRGKQLEQGFDVWETVPGITFDPQTDNHVTSEKTTRRLKELLGQPENSQKQFFVWAHYMDPHDQYLWHDECPKEWGKKNRDRYDCEIFHTDYWMHQFLEWARTQPWWSRTAVIVVGDHGEAFGEHGMFKHAFDLWDVLTRVGAFFYVPGAKPRHIDAARSHIDLAPTLLDLMGLEPMAEFMGKSLVPEIMGQAPDNREPIVTELNEDSHNPPVRAIIQGDYKLTVYGKHKGWRHALYNLKQDPGEEHDLAQSEPAELARMKELFFATFAQIPSVEPYGGAKLHGGGQATGPLGPPKAAASSQSPR